MGKWGGLLTPRITGIKQQVQSADRVSIYIDNAFCTGMRKRVADALQLKIGDEYTCEKLKEMEAFIWKKIYNWKDEKPRIEAVVKVIEKLELPISILVTGFGANSQDVIYEHPKEKGSPDLTIVKKANQQQIIGLEVTGTAHPRGDTIWLRKDKIEYAKNHKDLDYWAAVVLGDEIFYVKPDLTKEYKETTKQISKDLTEDGKTKRITIDEYYVEIQKTDPEVKGEGEFLKHLKKVTGG